MTNERLCTLAQRGDTQAQEQLVQNNLGYIRKTANELYISVGLGNSELGIDHDDLIQEGSIGLLRAISLYDPGKKIKFLTYAGPAIRNAMMDLISAAFATFEQRMQSDKDRLVNNEDIRAIGKAVAFIDNTSYEMISVLPQGACIFTGVASNFPVLVQVDLLPKQQQPQSSTINLTELWKEP